MGERGLRVKFIPVCDCQTSLLHELTEATASQGLGLEPDHVCSVVMLALMWPSALHSTVQPIFGTQTRRLLPAHSFGKWMVKLWLCLVPQRCKVTLQHNYIPQKRHFMADTNRLLALPKAKPVKVSPSWYHKYSSRRRPHPRSEYAKDSMHFTVCNCV